MPLSRAGTRERSRVSPHPARAAISNAEEVSPAAPMSWIPTTRPLPISSRQHSISSFSVKGSPTCTVGRFSLALSSKTSEAMVAPWMPSRPVFDPRYTTLLPGPEARPKNRPSARATPTHMTFTRTLPL